MLRMVVTKQFEGAGERRLMGEVVDVERWRTVKQLQAQRYLRPLELDDKLETCGECGREFLVGQHSHKAEAEQPKRGRKAKAEESVAA